MEELRRNRLIRIFCGYDPREKEGWHVFSQSIIEKTSEPVSIIPLTGKQRDGTNAFTYARFLVPYLCDFKGFAIFADGVDMLLRSDLYELWALREGWHAVQVVKHDYKTKHKRKYVGTPMESENLDYPRKNWSSLMLWDCGHYMNRCLTPESVAKLEGSYLHRFAWLPDDRIGGLPSKWNHLVGESEFDPEAKIAHFTHGIPSFEHYKDCDYADEWRRMRS